MKNCSSKIRCLLKNEIDPAYIDRAEIILREICKTKRGKFLEVGCGRGFYLKAADFLSPNLEIIGIDLNSNYLQVARKYVDNPKIKIEKGDAHKLRFANESVDLVVASEILEHVDDDLKVLKEMRRVLKKNKKVIVSVPNHNYPFYWDPLNWILEKTTKKHLPADKWWLAGIWAGHKRLYYEDELKNKIKASGFKIEKIFRTTHYCLPAAHFLLYGIGKNIVEKGWLKDFNRFEKNRQYNHFLQLIKKIFNIFDKKNKENFAKDKTTVGLVMILKK